MTITHTSVNERTVVAILLSSCVKEREEAVLDAPYRCATAVGACEAVGTVCRIVRMVVGEDRANLAGVVLQSSLRVHFLLKNALRWKFLSNSSDNSTLMSLSMFLIIVRISSLIVLE